MAIGQHHQWLILMATVLIVTPIWSGCLNAPHDQPSGQSLTPNPPGLDPLVWATNETGPAILGVHYEAAHGAQCTLKGLMQGTADALVPIWAKVIDPFDAGEGAPPGSHDLVVATNRWASGLQLDAAGVVANQPLLNQSITALGDLEYYERWVAMTNTSFTSLGGGMVWLAAPAIEWHGNPSRGYDEDWAIIQELGGDSMKISFACDDPDATMSLVHGRNALLFSQAPDTGALYAHALCSGSPCVYAGAANAFGWEARSESFLYGFINPELAKTIVVELNHPEGTTRWISDPSTRLGVYGLGDVFFKHKGPQGDYELSISGWSIVFGNIKAIVIDA